MNNISIDIKELCRYTNEEYISLIQIGYVYCQKILTFIPRVDSLKDYPSHGIDHSVRIIEYINKFITSFEVELSEEEIYLLYLAAWCHDIGCICGRDNHHKDSVKVLRGSTGFFNEILDDKTKKCLKSIILTHRKDTPFDDIPELYEGIKLKFLCAIFRLMDACDISSERCPRIVYEYIKESLNDTSKKYWKAHLNIASVSFYDKSIWIDLFEENEALEYIKKEFVSEIMSISQIFYENGIVLSIKISLDEKEIILD